MIRIYIQYMYITERWYAHIETNPIQEIFYKFKPSEDKIKNDFGIKEARVIWES